MIIKKYKKYNNLLMKSNKFYYVKRLNNKENNINDDQLIYHINNINDSKRIKLSYKSKLIILYGFRRNKDSSGQKISLHTRAALSYIKL